MGNFSFIHIDKHLDADKYFLVDTFGVNYWNKMARAKWQYVFFINDLSDFIKAAIRTRVKVFWSNQLIYI